MSPILIGLPEAAAAADPLAEAGAAALAGPDAAPEGLAAAEPAALPDAAPEAAVPEAGPLDAAADGFPSALEAAAGDDAAGEVDATVAEPPHAAATMASPKLRPRSLRGPFTCYSFRVG